MSEGLQVAIAFLAIFVAMAFSLLRLEKLRAWMRETGLTVAQKAGDKLQERIYEAVPSMVVGGLATLGIFGAGVAANNLVEARGAMLEDAGELRAPHGGRIDILEVTGVYVFLYEAAEAVEVYEKNQAQAFVFETPCRDVPEAWPIIRGRAQGAETCLWLEGYHPGPWDFKDAAKLR